MAREPWLWSSTDAIKANKVTKVTVPSAKARAKCISALKRAIEKRLSLEVYSLKAIPQKQTNFIN